MDAEQCIEMHAALGQAASAPKLAALRCRVYSAFFGEIAGSISHPAPFFVLLKSRNMRFSPPVCVIRCKWVSCTMLSVTAYAFGHMCCCVDDNCVRMDVLSVYM